MCTFRIKASFSKLCTDVSQSRLFFFSFICLALLRQITHFRSCRHCPPFLWQLSRMDACVWKKNHIDAETYTYLRKGVKSGKWERIQVTVLWLYNVALRYACNLKSRQFNDGMWEIGSALLQPSRGPTIGLETSVRVTDRAACWFATRDLGQLND